MKLLSLTVVILALGLLSGCFTHGRSMLAFSAGIGVGVSSMRPPNPYIEHYGSAPRSGYFWVPGVWIWDGWQYTWRKGYWEAERPGYRYQPHIWKQKQGKWHLHGGKWNRIR